MSYDPLQSTHHQVYGNDNPAYTQSTGYITPARPQKQGTSKWIKIGIPVAVLVIAGAVVGGIVGSRKHSSSAATSSAAQSAAASSQASAKLAEGVFATATNSLYQIPVYPSTTNTALYTTPTVNTAAAGWPSDPFVPASPSVQTMRPDRPRLIAPSYKWDALPALIASDPYLAYWNASIFNNASQYDALPAVVYFMDGDSGILDVARQVKQRVKAFGYVFRMTNNTHWVDRTWEELQNAAGNSTGSTWATTGPDRWNSAHFLDTAELSAAYGIAYDWMYDSWSDDQKSMIRSTLIEYGLGPGVQAYTNSSVTTGWWANNIKGNWNCVCNNGLTMGSLAILGDDTTGFAAQLLGLTVDNAKENCALAVSPDGTWSETDDYWYFGSTGHAEMAASLISATGSDYDLLTVNPDFWKTGLFHIYGQGATGLFGYGDSGPNKYTATSNSLILYANAYNQPQYALFQRDQTDAADPWSMFWYNPQLSGAFWDGLPLDYAFDNSTDQWMSMRSSFTDANALYVAIKAGTLQGHQTHNDLDVGDFVIDALGTRWAGELGDGDYRSPDYFSNDTQGSARWMYYRKMTEGQNTLLVGAANQDVTANPTMKFGTSNTTQGSSTVFTPPSDSTAFFVTDMTSAYAYLNVTSVKRGIRLLNGRKQVLLQDEITTGTSFMWRMHTNATVSASGTTATLTIDDKKMDVSILNAPAGAAFTSGPAERLSTDVTPPAPDQPNPGVVVLIISLPAGTYNLQVLFSPQWNDGSTAVTPPSVDLDSWTLTSHNT
ncbi:chondroitin AC/alginate lyase [Mycena alexandri]|uniref:Chondroitin AC/alginate lyase n=1 Tax=Mycena alexandri TaxID=1745969 RepID=A0AAD6TBP2_9AGAR|nr:chondroitin AC/alginate lyase [Mycena alexandri]